MPKTEGPVIPADEAVRDDEHEAYLAFRADRHNRRLAKEVAGLTLGGVRMHAADNPENGTVVNFTPAEAKKVAAVIADVVRARVKE